MEDEGYERMLGVTEAMRAAAQQCPNGSVRRCAEVALESVASAGAEVLREQVFLVLGATAGWRGARAEQVKRSLKAFLETDH